MKTITLTVVMGDDYLDEKIAVGAIKGIIPSLKRVAEDVTYRIDRNQQPETEGETST